MQPTQPFRSAMFKLPSCDYGMEVPQTKLTKQWSIQQTPVLTPICTPTMNAPILNLMPSCDSLDLNAGTGCIINDECKSDKSSFKTISSSEPSSPSSNAMTESTENESYTESELAQINDDVVLAV